MKYIGFCLLGVLIIAIALEINKNSRAQQYLVNCKRVEPGMTVKQAEKIMGDEDGSDHSVGKGELQYITPPFARTGTTIYFNPEADLVTEVICSDQKWSGF
jgi:hypothetical protein